MSDTLSIPGPVRGREHIATIEDAADRPDDCLIVDQYGASSGAATAGRSVAEP